MNDLQRTGGSAKDIATENGGASKIARDGCSGPSWCELTPSDRRSSSSVHQLASLGVAGGRGHRRVIHETIERAGGNKQNASHHVPTSPFTQRHDSEQPLQFRTAMWGYLPLFNHTCPLCKDQTRPTNVCLQPHPILRADQFGRGYSLGLRVDPVSTGPPCRMYFVPTISHSHSIRMVVNQVCNGMQSFHRDDHRTFFAVFS
jgi:hypothetical protein